MGKMATILTIVAFLFVGNIEGSGLQKLRLKIRKEKDDVIVEVQHKPQSNVRWIYVEAMSDSKNGLVTQSLIQAEGENCPVVHVIKWRNVPKVGILTVEAIVRDESNRNLDVEQAKIIMGPAEEQQN